MPTRKLNPTFAVLYLLVVAVGVFWLHQWQLLLAVTALQVAFALATGMPVRAIAKTLRKLVVFSLLIVVSYALWGPETGEVEQHFYVPHIPWQLSLTGLLFGCAMVLRVASVVLASAWIRRQGQPGDFVAGLRALRIPESLAQLLDRTLWLLEAHPEARGDKKNRNDAGTNDYGIKRLLKGDMSPLFSGLESALKKAANYRSNETNSYDLVLLSGVLLSMLSIKAVKILPGIPFAPGYKGVILLPLYFIAAYLSRRRFGATLVGTAFGILSFLFGDGRYGVFEVLKHITPGLIADGFAPMLRRARPNVFLYSFIGTLMAVGRWATIAAIVVLVEAPGTFVALLLPVALVHLVFGALSGIATRVLLGGAESLRAVVTAQDAASATTASEPSDKTMSDSQEGRRGSGSGEGGGRGRGRGDGSGRGRRQESQV